MPTILPTTGIRISRKSQNLSNPGDGASETDSVVYTGQARVVDASSDSEYDRFFPSGEQNAKRYLVYCEPSWGVANDDVIEFNSSELGLALAFDAATSDTRVVVLIPRKTGTLKLLGARRIEAFCISSN